MSKNIGAPRIDFQNWLLLTNFWTSAPPKTPKQFKILFVVSIIYDHSQSLRMSRHNIEGTKLAFLGFGGQIGYIWLICGQTLTLQRPPRKSKYILVPVSIIYVHSQAFQMSRHNIRHHSWIFRIYQAKICQFILIFDQFLALKTIKHLKSGQNAYY